MKSAEEYEAIIEDLKNDNRELIKENQRLEDVLDAVDVSIELIRKAIDIYENE